MVLLLLVRWRKVRAVCVVVVAVRIDVLLLVALVGLLLLLVEVVLLQVGVEGMVGTAAAAAEVG